MKNKPIFNLTDTKKLTSVLCFGKRGHYGDSKYPGNCSGKSIKLMLEYYRSKYVLDPAEGSGTCRDVCNELKINYDGFDIKNGDNLFTHKYERKYDFIHFHPPYWTMKREEYLAMNNSRSNLSNCKQWNVFILKLKLAVQKLWDCALKKNGIFVILCGLIKKNDRMYDMASELILFKPENFQHEIIKMQMGIDLFKQRATKSEINKKRLSKYTSDFTIFGNPFIPTRHEKYVIFKK